MADVKLETVSTISQLKSLSPTAPSAVKQVEVRGYYSEGDNGGGTFYWDAGCVLAANDGTVIASTVSSPGRWRRIINSHYYDVRWFGARDSSGSQLYAVQNTLSINTALQSAIQNRVTLYGVGYYFVSDSIVANANSKPGPDNIVQGVSVWGRPFGMPYNSSIEDSGFTIAASDTFPNSKAIFDLQYTSRSSINYLSINGRGRNVTGIGFNGKRALATEPSAGQNNLEHCSICNCAIGIAATQSGLLHINYNNISGCSYIGIALFSSCGDSTLIGNYVNTNNSDYSGTDLYSGTGILVAYGCGNTNIIGGKIEWNSKGILVYGSNGVNISSINFDANKQTHILLAVPDLDIGQQCRGFSIVNCRFLSGGTIIPAGLDYPGTHISLIADDPSKSIRGTITGCTFRRASAAGAADEMDDPKGKEPLGPKISAIKAAGRGEILAQVAGCDFKNACVGAAYIIASGPNIKIDATGKSLDVTKAEHGGAIVTLV